MTMLQIAAVLLTLAAFFGFINVKLMGLPSTVGLMVLALGFSLALVAVAQIFPVVGDSARGVLDNIDFNRAVLNGVLGYILFAGALHVDLEDLKQDKLVVGVLATLGVLISTALVGGFLWLIVQPLNLTIPVIYCLLFGALISPTDPIAVLAILKSLGAPRPLEIKIAGEALFNDGVGVVVFLALLEFANVGGHALPSHDPAAEPPPRHAADTTRLETTTQTHAPPRTANQAAANQAAANQAAPHAASASPSGEARTHNSTQRRLSHIVVLFVKEAVGGAAFGLAIGFIAYFMLKRLDNYQTEVLITLALVTGGYALAMRLGLSGPIAIVVAGLLIGNQGRALAMSELTRHNLDMFWELIDEMLNAVLFVLIGVEVLALQFNAAYLVAGLAAIPLVLLARWIAVGGSVSVLRLFRFFTPHTVTVMTWGGLRGGISVALALALRQYTYNHPSSETLQAASDLIVAMTYIIVLFSIIVQGLTARPLLRYLGLTRFEQPEDVSEPQPVQP